MSLVQKIAKINPHIVEKYMNNGIRKYTFSKVRNRPISTQVLDQTRNYGRGHGGLDPCPFSAKERK